MAELVEQALFGYDDGHRLLQTSSRLSNYEKDLLLQLSDLAPGISRLPEEGYWTGMPLREASRYAFVRTWPAPEMPRPGCVWSHVLLVRFDQLRPLDVVGLAALFQRPTNAKSLKDYSEPLSLGAIDSHKMVGVPRAEQLVACIYQSDCSSSDRLSQADLGQQALAIWGQQWPALQVNFSFRTVEKNASGRSWLYNFDLMLNEGSLRLQRQQPRPIFDGGGFERALVEDLGSQLHPRLGQFRVQYGQDMPLHPTWTAFLCSIQLSLETAAKETDHLLYASILREVAISLPERSEGLHLKEALLSVGSSSPFQLPQSFSTEALRFGLEKSGGSSFPVLALTEESIVWLWETDQRSLLEALTKKIWHSTYETRVLQHLIRSISQDSLMEGAVSAPSVRRSLVMLDPTLLSWKGLKSIPADELTSLLDTVSESKLRELDIVRSLISTPDAELAAFLCDRFPEEVVFSVCAEGAYLTQASEPHQVVLRFVGEAARNYLNPAFMERLRTTTALLAFAAMLGFINRDTIQAGPLLWASPLFSAKVDSPYHQLQTLQAFALALALEEPRQGSEPLLEYSFESIHEAMRDSRLEYQASIIVEAILPDVKWWRRWDSCYRLRLAVIQAYAYTGLQPATFFQLARNEVLRGTLFHELESKDKYSAFLATLQQLSQLHK